MRLSEADFRQLAHSIKFIEYYWSRFEQQFPNDAATYLYRDEVKYFISHEQYNKLTNTKESFFTRSRILSRKDYRSIRIYGRICQNLKESLAKKENGAS